MRQRSPTSHRRRCDATSNGCPCRTHRLRRPAPNSRRRVAEGPREGWRWRGGRLFRPRGSSTRSCAHRRGNLSDIGEGVPGPPRETANSSRAFRIRAHVPRRLPVCPCMERRRSQSKCATSARPRCLCRVRAHARVVLVSVVACRLLQWSSATGARRLLRFPLGFRNSGVDWRSGSEYARN